MFLNENDKKTFRSIILLNELINGEKGFKTVSNGDDKLLEPFLIELMAKGYVSTSGMNYIATDKGKEAFTNFMKRYQEFLKLYDVFAFVDLEKGVFAFEKFFDFDTDEAWDSYKNQDQFEDLRIAVAIFKKINPAEIVFMSFINENRFDTKAIGWQIDLSADIIWKEIENICETAIKPDEIGEDAMVDMVTKGSELMIRLLKEEEARLKDDQNNQQETITEETVVEESAAYFEPYYNPFYISPFWLVPLFLW